MTVTVNAKDIQDAEPDFASRCPIALALCRITGSAWYVSSSSARRVGTSKGAPLPAAARTFVREFDEGRPVRPFTFQLVA